MSDLITPERMTVSRLRYRCRAVAYDGKVDLLEIEPGIWIPLMEIPAYQGNGHPQREAKVEDLPETVT